MTQARLGARFAPRAPRIDRVQRGPWPSALPAWFWTWTAWVDHGRPAGKRPPSAPARIPAWAWARYALHVRRPAPPPPPPPRPVPSTFQAYARPIICAEAPLSVLEATPPSYTAWLTADPAYRSWAEEAVEAFRRQGRLVGAWCNPAQVAPATLRQFAKDHEIPDELLMGQGETDAEFMYSCEAKLPAVVGNVSSLSTASRGMIASRRVAFLSEDYWNVMPWLVPNWEGLPVVCSVAGLYPGEGPYGRYVPLKDFVGTGRWSKGRDGMYHAAGPTEAGHPQDYALM